MVVEERRVEGGEDGNSPDPGRTYATVVPNVDLAGGKCESHGPSTRRTGSTEPGPRAPRSDGPLRRHNGAQRGALRLQSADEDECGVGSGNHAQYSSEDESDVGRDSRAKSRSCRRSIKPRLKEIYVEENDRNRTNRKEKALRADDEIEFNYKRGHFRPTRTPVNSHSHYDEELSDSEYATGNADSDDNTDFVYNRQYHTLSNNDGVVVNSDGQHAGRASGTSDLDDAGLSATDTLQTRCDEFNARLAIFEGSAATGSTATTSQHVQPRPGRQQHRNSTSTGSRRHERAGSATCGAARERPSTSTRNNESVSGRNNLRSVVFVPERRTSRQDIMTRRLNDDDRDYDVTTRHRGRMCVDDDDRHVRYVSSGEDETDHHDDLDIRQTDRGTRRRVYATSASHKDIRMPARDKRIDEQRYPRREHQYSAHQYCKSNRQRRAEPKSNHRDDNHGKSRRYKSRRSSSGRRNIRERYYSSDTNDELPSHSRRVAGVPRRGRKHHNIKPDKYDGTTCVETFLVKFETAATYNDWSPTDKAAHIKAALIGGAGNLLWEMHNATYEEIVEKLRRRYGSRDQQEKFRVELRYRKRKADESLQELAHDVEKLVTLAYPEAGQPTRDILGRDAFIDSLNNPGFEYKVREKAPQTFSDAVTLAMKLEVLYKSREIQKESQKPRFVRGTREDIKADGPADHYDPRKVRSVDFTGQSKANSDNNDNRQSTTCYRSDRRTQEINEVNGRLGKIADHAANDSAYDLSSRNVSSKRDIEKEVEELRAQIAYMSGQLATASVQQADNQADNRQSRYSNLPHPLQNYSNQNANGIHPCQTSIGYPTTYNARERASRPPYSCYGCGEIGHFRRNCPYPQQMRGPSQQTGQQQQEIRGAATASSAAGKVYLNVKINRRTYQCLLDTGCEITVIPARLVEKRKIQSTTRNLFAANGTEIPVLGWTSMTAVLGNMTIQINGLVSEHVTDIMLGIGWLQDNGVRWDFVKGEVIIGATAHKLVARRNKKNWCRRVIAAQDIVVPPLSQLDLPAKAVYNELHTDKNAGLVTWATEPGELKEGLLVARAILPDRAKELLVRVLNASDEPIKVCKGTVISDLQPVSPIETQEQRSSELEHNDDTIVEEMISKVDKSVPTNVREQLRAVLTKYSTVFSRGDLDLGWTDLVTHNIDTGDHKPIRQQMRRYPPVHLHAIDKQLSDMLQQGVIEPAASPWASNIVLAKKKDGTLRCCIDFRHINEITRKDAYPLPRMDQCLDAMTGSSWFSTFDLRSGFHQVCMAPEDADKTAFITRRGMYRFRTMPFGLCNAVATFQRLMDLVLSGLNLEVCLTYLDDIILFSATPEQHLERLEMVLRRLQQANLKLKPSKCSLMQRKVTFLGHVVSGEGISTDPEKVQLIEQWPAPTNLRQLRGFIGLTGYYRRFVQGYSTIAAPLNDLMKKDRRFQWTEECQRAFSKLKEALVTSPVLALPNDEDVFILDTDAAETSIGSVLSQLQNGEERVVAYAGRSLNRNEVNYCVTRKELLAIVHFTRHFRQYLLGRQFIIRTDHAALSWLQKTPQPIGQNARWLELLGEYDFIVKHRNGTSHGNADAMSRHLCLTKPSCTACHSAQESECAVVTTTLSQNDDGPADTLGWTNDEISTAQKHDPEINRIITLMTADKNKPAWSEVESQSSDVKLLWNEWERLEIRERVLCRKWTFTDGTGDKWQIILPRAYRAEFIRLAHTGMTGGHLGRSKTEQQVRQRAYWPNWRTQVAMELKRCTACAQYHRGKAPRQTLLHPFTAGEPFEVIAVDVTGKHPRSARGNEYIITATDIFSKWSEAFPVRVHTAPVVAKVLVDNLFSRFGMPKRILTDQGPEFESELFKELCFHMGIEKIRTTPYKPSTNGCVERFHRTLNSMLAKVVQLNQRDWDERLPSVMAAYRAAKHESTNFSPNQLVLGRENRAPVDLVLEALPGEEEHYESFNDYVCELQRRMRESYALAREHLDAAAERRKNEYDIKVKSAKFEVGQWVWYLYPRRYTKRSPKWCRNYEGPFLVVQTIPPCDYVIQRSRRSTPQVVHGDKLKRCHGETPASWLQLRTTEERSANEVDSQQLTDKRDDNQNGNAEVTAPSGVREKSTTKSSRREVSRQNVENDDVENPRPLPPRSRRRPARFYDYKM